MRSAALFESLEGAYFETLAALAPPLAGGSARADEDADAVAASAVAVGQRLGLPDDELRDLRYAAVLRNIGQVGVPATVLGKHGPLTGAERAAVERHSLLGEQLLARVELLGGARAIVRHSHERWDGRGYPDGLAGERIPAGARILSVCDAHRAMTSVRPYREPLPETDARAELSAAAGTQFDARVVRAFLELDAPRPARAG